MVEAKLVVLLLQVEQMVLIVVVLLLQVEQMVLTLVVLLHPLKLVVAEKLLGVLLQ